MSKIQEVYQQFKSTFNKEPILVCSPGRVNLIGEHTDYNEGLVLPAAIDKYIYLAIQKRDDDDVNIISADYNDGYSGSIANLQRSGLLWPDYLLGVADQLIKKGHKINGFDAIFSGDIPQGAGLSSSAALECATAFGLSELFELNLSKLEIAKVSRAAENHFVGVQCGLMDQFASVFGKEQNLIRLDCKDESYEYIPFLTDDIKIILFDTRVKHSLASSAYNERRQQCERGVALINKHESAVKSLRDANEEMLLKYVKPADEIVYQRCTYVVAEIARLLEACDHLQRNDFEAFGKKMYETHDGLQHQYEVSCPELDCLVDLSRPEPEILGARMMGGGFGGCTINIVRSEDADALIARISEGYSKATGKELLAYVAVIGAGTRLVQAESRAD